MSLLVEISQFNDPFNGTTEVVLVEGTTVYDEFLNSLRVEVKDLADQVTADKKVVAADKATVTSLKGQTQTLRDQTQALKNQVDTAKSSVDASLASVTAIDKEIEDHLTESTALKTETTKQAGIATSQATKAQQQATIATTQANTATTQANAAKTQADAAKQYLDDFKANPSTTGDLNVGGVLKVNGVNIASTYETKPDAAAKLTTAKAYTDSEITKLKATDTATLDALKKINAEIATGGSIIESIQTNKLDKAGDTMTGSLKIESNLDSPLILNCLDTGPHYITFQRSGDNRFFIRQTTLGNIATDSFEFLSGVKDSGGNYVCPLRINSTGVYSNTSQNSAANALTRKDYVDAQDAKQVTRTGDSMTGNLDFHNDDQGIRVKFPGGSVSNNSGVFGGKGDAAQKDKTNININSWYGVGFSPTTTTAGASVVAAGENSIWFNLRNGNMYTVGRLFVDEDKEVYSPVNKPKWEDVGGGGYFNIVTDHIQAKDKWVRAATATTGFIPYAAGTTGTSSIGTSSWWFKDSYVVNTNTKLVDFGNCTIKEVSGDLVFSV
ncbi:tail fiber protein [Aeromonas salmonicida]|uniref:tail fiber protein n=1 Tax=Aeromonas salmonicida TaxID=645 RepID=UPI003D30FDCD